MKSRSEQTAKTFICYLTDGFMKGSGTVQDGFSFSLVIESHQSESVISSDTSELDSVASINRKISRALLIIKLRLYPRRSCSSSATTHERRGGGNPRFQVEGSRHLRQGGLVERL